MTIFKNIFYITLIVLSTTLFAHALTDKSINIIKSTKNIQYLSQKISKDYLYIYYNPKKTATKTELNNSIKKLEESLRIVAKNTHNLDTKNILDFLSYGKDQIKELLNSDISKQNSILILEYSETIFEGAQSILNTNNYDYTTDKDIKTNLMRILKSYMAIHTKINKDANIAQLEREKILLKKRMKFLNSEVNQSWQPLEKFLETKDNYFIPDIVSILVKNIEDITQEHDRNN